MPHVKATEIYLANPNYPVKLFLKWNTPRGDQAGMWYEALHFTAAKLPKETENPKYHLILAYRRLCIVLRNQATNMGALMPDELDLKDRTKTKKWTKIQAAFHLNSDLDHEENGYEPAPNKKITTPDSDNSSTPPLKRDSYTGRYLERELPSDDHY